jgi:hypothetical protein
MRTVNIHGEVGNTNITKNSDKNENMTVKGVW